MRKEIKTNFSKRNRSKDITWINDFIKTHRDDADTPMLKVMQLLRNSMDQIKELEAEIKKLKLFY